MVPFEFSDFFAASAGVAGALIGLLFVAISVAPALTDPGQRVDADVRAGVAFSALTNALVVALLALVPGIDMGVAAAAASAVAAASCVALGILLMRAGPIDHRWRKLRLIAAQGLVFVYELVTGVSLVHNPHNESAVKTLAIVVVVLFLIGIGRAWQLLGARDTGILQIVREALQERAGPAVAGDPGQPDDPGDSTGSDRGEPPEWQLRDGSR